MNLRDKLAEADPFVGLHQPVLQRLAESAQQRQFETDEKILVAGQPADELHVIVSGRAAVHIESAAGQPILIDTIGPGQVLGISWLLAPYLWTFGANAAAPTETIAIDALALRASGEADPALGFELYRRFSTVIHDRLASARLRLLDFHGGGPA